MFNLYFSCLFLLIFFSPLAAHLTPPAPEEQIIEGRKNPSRMYSEITIAFGSVYNPTGIQEPNIFEKIEEFEPDVFAWVGDLLLVGDQNFDEDEEILNLKKNPGYSRLSNKAFVTGIADIGYYGDEERNRFFYFFGEEYHSYRRENKELYESIWIKTKPNPYYDDHPQKLIKLILLQVEKFFEEDEIEDDQFAWLGEELKEEKKDHILTVIASPYQILPNDRNYDETLEIETKLKLLKYIRRSAVPVVLISGSLVQSFGEVMKYPCSNKEIGYDLYEMTSSGLNTEHSAEFRKLNKFFVPPTFSNFSGRAFRANFGLLRIKYNHVKPSTSELVMEIVNEKGKMLVSRSVYLPEKKRYSERDTDMSLSCARDLYSNSKLYSALARHMLTILRDPEFRVYLMMFFWTFMALLFGCGIVGSRIMRKKMGSGGIGALDEYETYHME